MKKKGIYQILVTFILMIMILAGIGATANAASKMKLNKTKATVSINNSVKLRITGAKKNITWKSSNKNVATVKKSGNNGAIVKAKKQGKTTITAKVGKTTLKCKITVKKKSLNDTGDKIFLVGTHALYFVEDGHKRAADLSEFAQSPLEEMVTARKSRSLGKKVTISSVQSSNPSVISVKQISGKKIKFTYYKTGKTTITAVYKGRKLQWKIVVRDDTECYKIKRGQIYQEVGITNDMKDQYKCFLLAKWLCDNNTYDFNARNNKTGEGHYYRDVFDKGRSVCSGYADAYKFLMDGLGIPCRFVNNDTINHEWNQVQIDGIWYNVDVTWMDSRTYNMSNFLVSDYVLGTTRSEGSTHKATDTRFDNISYDSWINGEWVNY